MQLYLNDPFFGFRGSVVGFCATYTENFCEYFSDAVYQRDSQEIADCLHPLFSNALKYVSTRRKGGMIGEGEREGEGREERKRKRF